MSAARTLGCAALTFTLLAGCNKPANPPGGASPAGGTTATASKEWKPFEFPNGGFTVEAPGTPALDTNSSDEEMTAYRSEGDGFSVGILLQKLIDEAPEKEIELHEKSAPQNFPGATSKRITHDGLAGIDVTFPPSGSGMVSISRYLYLNGKEIHLQFNIPKGGDQNALAPQRDRFFNSLKVKK